MVALPLSAPFRFIVVGSPAYLARRAAPVRPEDLRGHACLRLRRAAGPIASWSLVDGGHAVEIAVSGPLIANDFTTVLGAALRGVGLAQVPEPIARDALASGQLVDVLAAHAPTAPGMFLYYPSRLQALPKLRAFIEHAKRHAPVHAG